jgi:oxidase EvaA
MVDHGNLEWLRERLKLSLEIELSDPTEILDWLERRRKQVPFTAELIALREVANWHQDDNGNFYNTTGHFFRIEGVRVRSAPGLREIAGWDQPIFTQLEGGILALICRETPRNGIEFLLQAKADPGNIGYLQFCPTIQSTWENIRGLKGASRPPFVELLDASSKARLIYKSKHNEEGSRFWRKSNENMILFVEDAGQLPVNDSTYKWASLSQIKQIMLLDNIVGPYVRTVIAPL